MDASKKTKAFLIAYVILFAASFWLLFFHLDNHLLWGDEAETAVLARNVVQFGVPQTFDGTNYILLHGTVDETPTHVWVWSPWMQDYLAASSFLVFGESTWSARAPFAFIGWGCVLLLALVSWKIYRSHWVALSAAALLATSEVFLLHARQCRYYPISVFGEILFIYGIFEMFASRRRGAWLAALALILQFYSNYIIVVANLPAVLCVGWLLRKQGRAAVLQAATMLGALFIAALPWLVYAHSWGQKNALGDENYLAKVLHYFAKINFDFLPFCIFLLPLLGLFFRDHKPDDRPAPVIQWEHFLLLLLPLYFLAILCAPGCYDRYLLPLLPVMGLLAVVWAFRYIKWRALAIGLLLIQMTSNFIPLVSAFSFRHGRSLRSPIAEYISGISTPYTDRFADVLAFFKTHARPGQTVLSYDPEFPLFFYARLTVINGRIMAPVRAPDWVLPIPASGVVLQSPMLLPDSAKSHYTSIILPVHDTLLSASVPEPGGYQYHTTPSRALFLIYELNSLTNEPASR
jgi:4-amino-4-deoxy-L-arabinose transferase-like glycosyltransferase